jgi:UDP-N-acetyl-alpha-D-muramoyl-L-alanyl-L-glutamate epimerase
VFNSRQQDFLQFRQQYKCFYYHGFEADYTDGLLRVVFKMEIEGLSEFNPAWEMPFKFNPFSVDAGLTENLLFHLGLLECISYWKLSCSPLLIVKPYKLDDKAVNWWKELFYKGLGEFRYLNGIDVTQEDFLRFAFSEDALPLPGPVLLQQEENCLLVPVGGGKDSAVSLSLLTPHGKRIPFMINPVTASQRTLAVESGLEEAVVYRRTLDASLLRLNKEGFLNGHTPFSALLAFASLLAAWGGGASAIALSNEASANEDTIPGSGINHQYSKSWDFEQTFRSYVSEHILQGIRYFSFLRPLSELAIAGIFAQMPRFHNVFRSCNAGSKEGIWCKKCPKCLFAYLMLASWLDEHDLLAIFGAKLLNDPAMQLHLDELAGISAVKPFECVGTISEVRLSITNIRRRWDESDCQLLHQARFDELDLSDGLYRTAWKEALKLEQPHDLNEAYCSTLKNRIDEIMAAKLDRQS